MLQTTDDKQAADDGPSEVAMWHRRSGLPDNVTDEGLVVAGDEGRRVQAEKQALRAAIARLSAISQPHAARAAARLAASYLLAGDVETARRYVARAEGLSQEAGSNGGT